MLLDPPLIYYTITDSPLGQLLLTSDGTALTGLYMNKELERAGIDAQVEHSDAEPFTETIKQLRQYFQGQRPTFAVPIKLAGTDFQIKVWSQLLKISYGQTISYGELAKRIGNASAARAVGLANGSNRISIIVPCHRVIGADGTLTGYGGGLANKKLLLELECSVAKQLTFAG